MAQKNNKKQNSGKKALITVIAIVAAVIIIGLAAFNAVKDKGIILRSKTAAESDNYTVSGTMMAYSVASTLQSQTMYDTMTSLGVDFNKSLKEQFLPTPEGSETMSWFDYITMNAKNSVSEIVSLCEYAKANGIELGEEGKASVKANMDSLAATAASYNYPNVASFVRAAYGNGINEKDVEKFVEMYVLSSIATEKLVESAEPTTEEEDAYYAEHPEEFDGVDYYEYSVKLNAEETEDDTVEIDVSEEESAADVLDAIAFAKTLSEAKDAEEFKALVREYEATLDPEADDEALDKIVENTFVRHSLKSAVTNEEVAEWLFDKNNVGAVKLFTDEDNGTYTVYVLDKEAYRDDTINRSVRHILLKADEENPDDDTAAQDILAQLKEADFSEEKWNELAAEYSTDAGSNQNGGLYEGIIVGQTYAAFNDWLFDEAREEGDSGIVKTDAGWHVMYYVGETEKAAWMANADNAIISEKYNKVLEDNGASIKFNDDVINMIKF